MRWRSRYSKFLYTKVCVAQSERRQRWNGLVWKRKGLMLMKM